jgi:hypothetical protein
VRAVRDEIARRVKALVRELDGTGPDGIAGQA